METEIQNSSAELFDKIYKNLYDEMKEKYNRKIFLRELY